MSVEQNGVTETMAEDNLSIIDQKTQSADTAVVNNNNYDNDTVVAEDTVPKETEKDVAKETENYVAKEEEKDVAKETEEDDDSRKLFVGGLSWETTEEDLRAYFETWGKVTACSIKLDKMTGNSRGFGFVSMETEECMRKVMLQPEHRLKNKKIDPKPAKPTREPVKKIFVGGLLPEISEEQIKEYFSKFGQVESVDLPFDTQKGKRKPYIFLSFTTEEAAKQAILNEKQDVCGHKCDVRIAVPREQVVRSKMATWGPFGAGGVSMYPPHHPHHHVSPADYYSYEYPAYSAAPYSYDNSGAYYSSGYYSGYPYGYSYPMPPQPYVAGGATGGRGAAAGGKMPIRGGARVANSSGSSANYHPYARPL